MKNRTIKECRKEWRKLVRAGMTGDIEKIEAAWTRLSVKDTATMRWILETELGQDPKAELEAIAKTIETAYKQAIEKAEAELAEVEAIEAEEEKEAEELLAEIRDFTFETETIDGTTIQVHLVDCLDTDKWTAIDQCGNHHVVLASMCR